MNEFITYGILTVALLTLELLYFRFACVFRRNVGQVVR